VYTIKTRQKMRIWPTLPKCDAGQYGDRVETQPGLSHFLLADGQPGEEARTGMGLALGQG